MDSNYYIIAGALLVGVVAYFIFFRTKKTPEVAERPVNKASAGLQLQAYERLSLLVDRITLTNLVNRTSHDGLTARDMQVILTRSIRDEFDYNITQQIYIAPEVWSAVKNLKEKNLLIVNQVSSIMPANATGFDLNKAILEYVMNDPHANQHELVSEALSFEAKKLL